MSHENKEILCARCGTCCRAGMALIHESDLARWEQEGREDILNIVDIWQPKWAGDMIVSASHGNAMSGCPFLQWEDSMSACSIYDTRPKVCKDFRPGSSMICPQYRK